MPTTRLLLQEPYKTLTEKEKQAQKQGKKVERKLNDRETRLYLYLILDADYKAKIKTEYVIKPEDWDFKTQQKKLIKGNEPGTPERNKKIQEFNDELNELKKDILEKYHSIIKAHPDFTFPQVAEMLKDYGKTKEIPFLQAKDKEFFAALDEFIEYLKANAAAGTVKKFNTLKLSLTEFCKSNPIYKNLAFGMIDFKFLDAYTLYLQSQKPRGRQKTRPEGFQEGLLINTVGKYIECVKTFCKWSEERKYNRNTTYKEFSNFTQANKKRKKQDHDIVTLSLSELRKFYSFDFAKAKNLSPEKQKSLERVRDLFCFSCFTGQRWSDIERFEKNQVQGDVWIFEAYKTKKITEIDLTGFAASAFDILQKYNFELPKISLTKFNLYVKEAAKAAGIDKEERIRRYVGARLIEISKPKYEFIGSHTARKTCVSILLNDYNVPITAVLEITQHSDLKTLQKYVNKDRKARREAMAQTKKIDELLTVKKAI